MILPKINIKWERWKFNKDYGIYVSTLGHFKDRYKRDIPVKINQCGYCKIKTEQGLRLAHRLVMMTWRPTDDAENLTVDHLDHNKRNNALYNLEWISFVENQRRAKEDFIDEVEKTAGKVEEKIGKIRIINCTKKKGSIIPEKTLTDEEFLTILLDSCKARNKKINMTEEELLAYIKNCKKQSKKYQLYGYVFRRESK